MTDAESLQLVITNVELIKQQLEQHFKQQEKRDKILDQLLFGEASNGLIDDVSKLKDRQSGFLWGLRAFAVLTISNLVILLKALVFKQH